MITARADEQHDDKRIMEMLQRDSGIYWPLLPEFFRSKFLECSRAKYPKNFVHYLNAVLGVYLNRGVINSATHHWALNLIVQVLVKKNAKTY